MGVRNIKEGMVFGRLTVLLSYTSTSKTKKSSHLCLCSCGSISEHDGADLRRGDAKSCGCLFKEGRHLLNTTHGKSHSPVWLTWVNMRARCFKPGNRNYHNYGGRDITICDKWMTFEGFYEDMGDKPFPKAQLDRIDVDGDYHKDNCRWVSNKQNANNKRNNRYIIYLGLTATLSQWCDAIGISGSMVRSRYYQGWGIEDMFTKASRKDTIG